MKIHLIIIFTKISYIAQILIVLGIEIDNMIINVTKYKFIIL